MRMEMKKTRPSLYGMICLLIVLGLMTGCYREAAPDVEPTVGAQSGQPEEGTPDLLATSRANSTIAAQGAEETPVGETPTVLPPTAMPTTAPTTVSITPVPTYTPLPATPAPTEAETETPPTDQVIHTVQRGENLFRIALHYGTTVEAIATANGIANPALIYVGQTLTISSSGGQPPATGETTYTVQPGDNLFRIALRYDMGYMYLAQYNNIANPSSIYVGQVLRIPPH
jgi:LysM repeat protein